MPSPLRAFSFLPPLLYMVKMDLLADPWVTGSQL